MRARIASLIGVLVFALPCLSQKFRYTGTWDAVDPGVTINRLVVETNRIHLFGTCNGKPCEKDTLKNGSFVRLGTRPGIEFTKHGRMATTLVDIEPGASADEISVIIRVLPLQPTTVSPPKPVTYRRAPSAQTQP